MTDLASLIAQPPDDFAGTVAPDWPFSEGRANESVALGGGLLPEFFSLIIEPHPVPDADQDRWNLLLCFQVMRGEDRSELRYASCAEMDLASALDAVRKGWSLSKWKQWAHVVLMLEVHPYFASADDLSRVREALSLQQPRRRQRTAVNDEHLRLVADVYRSALQKPTVAVQQHFKVSHSTAARWVGLARDAKHLPPAKP